MMMVMTEMQPMYCGTVGMMRAELVSYYLNRLSHFISLSHSVRSYSSSFYIRNERNMESTCYILSMFISHFYKFNLTSFYVSLTFIIKLIYAKFLCFFHIYYQVNLNKVSMFLSHLLPR